MPRMFCRPFPPICCAALVGALFLCTTHAAAALGPSTQPSPEQREARSALAAQCDALLESAVRSPFGWGWADEAGASRARRPARVRAAPPDRGRRHRINRSRSIRPRLPYWAWNYSGQDSFSATRNTSPPHSRRPRGVSSMRARSGQIRAQGVMGTSSGPMDVPADVPERFATRTALALMLTLIDADPPTPPAAEALPATDGAAGPNG